MRLSIQYKLFAAMLCASLLIVGFMTLIFQWSFDRGFLEYINIEEQEEMNRLARQLESYYDQHHSWQVLKDHPLEMLRLCALSIENGKARHRLLEAVDKGMIPDWLEAPQASRPLQYDTQRADTEERHHHKDEHRRFTVQRTVVLDENGHLFFGKKLRLTLPHLVPLMHGDQQVGSIGLYAPHKLMEANQLLFVEKQKLVIFATCAAAILVTVGLSLLLAYHLTKPIRKLSYAAKQLTKGDYSTRVSTWSKDELESLACDFNILAQTLEKNQQQRKSWVSDIAHELRTPLTSLKGIIEALQDGIRKPDATSYNALHQAVQRLERLVDDLSDLTRSDLGTLTIRSEHIELAQLLEKSCTEHHQQAYQAGLVLKLVETGQRPQIQGDPLRLQQLIDNLVTNSIRYTDRGGKILLSVKQAESQVFLDIQDTAPGVPAAALPKLFDRLYRVEQSRNRALGGSGLGLAICQQIAQGHGGSIQATPSPLGGLHIRVAFPLFPKEQV